MSRAVLEEILARAMEDPAFRSRLLSAPGQALENYLLTPQERQAFISGDLKQILIAADLPSGELED